MPVSSENTITGPYFPNGSTKSFPFDFKATAANEVVAVDQDGATISTALYSVTLDDDEGGMLNFSVAPVLAEYTEIYVMGDPALTQPSDFDNTGPSYNPAALTRAFDRAAIRDLKLKREIGRALKMPFGEAHVTFPGVAARANKYLSFLPDGSLFMASGTGADIGLRGDLGLDTGGEFSGFRQPDDGAVLRDHHEIATEVLRVTDFGAVGDDVADDQPAFAAAFAAASARGGALVFVPDPSVAYRLEAGLTIPSNCGLIGQTPKHTRLHHAFNGDMFVMGEGAKLINLYIDGDGANFTGKCMDYQGSAGRQSVRHVRATDWDGAAMNFATNAGSQSEAYDCRLARTNAGTTTGRFAVVIAPAQQLSARPRKFSLIETDGTCAFSFGGSNNTFVSNSFIGDIEYNAESRAVLITGTRVANQLALTVRGFNNSISGSDISPQITIASSSDNIALQGNSYNNLPIINNSGNGRNLIDAWRQSYTPTLTSGGTAPSLGDGTLVGYASCKGDTVTVTIILTVGSTTTLGSGDLRFSLPTWAPNSNGFVQVPGQAMLSRGSTIYSGIVQLPNGQNWVRLYRDTSGAVTFNSPATWAAGDTLRMTFTYMV